MVAFRGILVMSQSTKIALNSLSNILRVSAASSKELRSSGGLGAGSKAHLSNVERILSELASSLTALATVSGAEKDIPVGASDIEIEAIKEEQEKKDRDTIAHRESPFLDEEQDKQLAKRFEELGLTLEPIAEEDLN